MSPLPEFAQFPAATYVPREFRNSHTIKSVRSYSTPRFHHETSVEKLITGNKEEARSYLVGIGAVSSFIFGLFLLWAFLLFGLRCLGPRRVGVFSGRFQKPFINNRELNSTPTANKEEKVPLEGLANDNTVVPPSNETSAAAEDASRDESRAKRPPSDGADSSSLLGGQHDNVDDSDEIKKKSSVHQTLPDTDRQPSEPDYGNGAGGLYTSGSATENAIAEDDPGWQRRLRCLRRCRIAIVLAGLLVIISSIAFLATGIANIKDSVYDAANGVKKLKVPIQKGIVLCDDYIEAREDASHALRDIRAKAREEGWCKVQNPTLLEECEFDSSAEICNNSGVLLNSIMNATGNLVTDVVREVDEEVFKLREDLMESLDVADSVLNQISQFHWAYWASAGFVILLDILVIFLLVGVYLAWKDRLTTPFKCAQTSIVFPLFLFIVLLVWLFAAIFHVGSMMTSDFCFDSPDSRVEAILLSEEERFTSVVLSLALYYVRQCEGLPLELSDREEGLVTLLMVALRSVHGLISVVQGIDPAVFEEICGSDITPIHVVADVLDFSIHVLVDSVHGVREIFSCSRIHPIYSTVLYDAVCYHGTSGLWGLTVSLFGIMVGGMVMVTLRVSWNDIHK